MVRCGILVFLAVVCSDVVFAAQYQEKPITPPRFDSYEYIVVGSGAGGGPLAARLAQAGKRTLLIEAGDDQGSNPVQTIPVLHARGSENKEMSWNFFVKHYADETRQRRDTKTTWETSDGKLVIGNDPPTGANDAKMKGILYPRTGTLGGCTTHNALVSVYPHDADWRHIERLTGDSSWNSVKMRQIFDRMQKGRQAGLPSNSSANGDDGWFKVNTADVRSSVKTVQRMTGESPRLKRRQGPLAAVSNMLSVVYGFASVSSGASGMFSIFPTISGLSKMISSDLNNAAPTRDTTEGMFSIPLAIKDGKRVGSRNIVMETYSATTTDAKKMYPLDIALNTFVTKVTFNQSSSRPMADGVDTLYGANLYENSPLHVANSRRVAGHFKAEMEVILSAGAFNTPQILKLSGVGPKSELDKFQIPIVHDLPGVGTNLQDHMEIGVTHELGNIPDIGCTFAKNQNDPCLKRFKSDGSGTYGMATNGFPFAVVKKTSMADLDTDFAKLPDLFIFGGPASFRGYYPGYSDDSYKTGNWSWVILKAHTGNRAGTVMLRSANPLQSPEINFNFFDAGDKQAAERDLKAMAEGIKYSRAMSTARGPLREIYPGPGRGDSAAAIEQYIKDESWSHHASCTCPIGADSDKMAVLDSKLRVRGVDGLRVADASVFPRIPGFFIAVPTYMVGERAADFILNSA